MYVNIGSELLESVYLALSPKSWGNGHITALFSPPKGVTNAKKEIPASSASIGSRVVFYLIRVVFYPELGMPRPADDSRPVQAARGPVTVRRARFRGSRSSPGSALVGSESAGVARGYVA